MTVYSIFEKPQGKAAKNRVPQVHPPVAVPERFSWTAALLPPVFAVLNGLWLLLVFWIALVAGLYYIARVIGDDAAIWLYVLVALFMGFEAAAFRRDGLLARGFIWRGDLIATGEDIAQRDFLLVGPAKMTASVAIIDYGSGNLRSAAKAFERSVKALRAETEIAVTSDPDVVRKADRIVLPGVGAFEDCMSGLLAVRGMREVLDERVTKGAVPFLGICVGMQLMATEGHEKGVYSGLNWIMGPVIPLEPRRGLKVPHMGWNTLSFTQPHPLLANIPDGETGLHAYFVHSYHLQPTDDRQLFATADYGQQVTACVGRDNMFGTQFHPEKSQTLGLTLIENFLEWTP